MSKLYKKVDLLVSRAYYHGGEGLENCGLRFFRSHKEYEQEASEHDWNGGGSFKSSWCTPPVVVKAWVNPRDWRRFTSEEIDLSEEKVLFGGSVVTKVHKIGGLH